MKPDCDYVKRHKVREAFSWNPEAVEWMRSLPESLRPLVRRFPPSCLVKANHPYCCPREGEVAQVLSYIDPDGDHPDGSVTVYDPEPVFEALSDTRFQCDPAHLEVVGYWGDMTPELVDRILADETGAL